MENVTVKWKREEFVVELSNGLTVAQLQEILEEKSGVPVSNQKLMWPGKKKNDSANELEVAALGLKPSQKIVMVGSAVARKLVKPSAEEEAMIVNDLHMTPEEIVAPDKCEKNLKKVENAIKRFEIKETFAVPRAGKKLLVLDVDYTFFDHRSPAETAAELMRPFLHEFLETVQEWYDIIIWSATSYKWIELKLGEMGVTSNERIQHIVSFFDFNAMITVHSQRYGVQNVKPLQVIWAKYPGIYTPENTIMFDDIKRNFLMNPQNGLRIAPYRNGPMKPKDDELLQLTKYLMLIAPLESFSELRHSRWESYVSRRAHKLPELPAWMNQ